MEAVLVDYVRNSLQQFMYRNAIFICERLCTEFPSEVNLQLLAECYLRNNQPYAAYHILKCTQMAQSRYLFALSCFQMELLTEAEKALSLPNDPSFEVPNGAAGHYLLGLIYRYTDRRKSALLHFKQALLLDPLFWAAYEELCLLGSAEEATTVFNEAASLSMLKQQQQKHALTSCNLFASSEEHHSASVRSSGEATPRHLKSMNHIRDVTGNYQGTAASGGVVKQPPNGVSSSFPFYNTPSPMASQLSEVAPPPICRNVLPNTATANVDGSTRSTVNSTIQAPRKRIVDEGKFRKFEMALLGEAIMVRRKRAAKAHKIPGSRRTRLFGETGSSANSTAATTTGNVCRGNSWASGSFEEGTRHDAFDDSHLNETASTSGSLYGDARSLKQEGGTTTSDSAAFDESKVLSGVSDILGLLRLFGEGYRQSCLYKCQDSLVFYQKLPQRHYNTGWVLSQVGKAYSELVDYLEAERVFSLARHVSPYNLEGMDVYSTVLYHLKQDMKLSYLAQELISTDRLAPQTWCAMGNHYSLRRDHDTALKNFQRAVQLNPRFAYAHTLSGHECVALEDFENAVRSYQSALQVDSRHYNAWYGLGLVYLRQEKYEFSEHNFQIAFQINPHSSVIMSYLGKALHALKRDEEALVMMENAILADIKNPVPMYEKAHILISMERFDEALEVLEELKEHAPRECSVYALMGRIYKQCNLYDKAMLHFGLALDLKPSAADVAIIKAAIEKLHVPDDLDDSL